MNIFEIILTLSLAAVLGGVIGLQRRSAGKSAGTRTMALVALGAALFTMLSKYGFGGGDPGRVASQILTGMGFIGAGTIIHKRDGETIEGLTTAAALWSVSALGIAVGVGWYMQALFAAGIIVLILMLDDDILESQILKRSKKR